MSKNFLSCLFIISLFFLLSPLTYAQKKPRKVEIKKAEIRAEKERKLNIKKTAHAYQLHACYVMGNGSRQFKRSLDTATHNSINAWLFKFHSTKK